MAQVNGSPKIGDTINVRHRAIGGECEQVRDTVKRKVAGIYMGNKMVRDSAGENWVVKRSEDGTAWDTLF